MAKNAYYFKHDYNAHQDEKILDLRIDLGFEGYGVFWYLVEKLANATHYKLESNYKRIAFSCNMDPEIIKKVVEDYDLFEVKDGLFWSESLLRRMEKLDEIKEARSKAGKASAEKRANVQQVFNKCSTSDKQGVQQRKEKKRKEKESKEDFKPPTLYEILHHCFVVKEWYHFDPVFFFEKMDAENWDGVSNWKLKANTFQKKNFQGPIKRESSSYTKMIEFFESMEDKKKSSDTFRRWYNANKS